MLAVASPEPIAVPPAPALALVFCWASCVGPTNQESQNCTIITILYGFYEVQTHIEQQRRVGGQRERRWPAF